MTVTNPTPDKYYTLSTPTTPPKLLSSSSSRDPTLTPATEASPHNRVYFTTTLNPGYFRIHTRALGNDYSLGFIREGGEKKTMRWFGSGSYKDQYWRLDAWSDGTVRLSDWYHGEEAHLDVSKNGEGLVVEKGDKATHIGIRKAYTE
ncbi:hypothetical protein EJ06DRAFT_377203 [Trichodelitschia bisporula]|uniref:Ricin B lectin domain-containing protein n=1 Tax=Trichodelitschia bisporula TaxID=703511 RepID=A0A6G1HYV0_9PEZI|nr:hypothetical protein EJ06DRAFT_377203 [Trichodelitschia bisporula]